ncbi:MAG: DUF559 domain-containing protein [Brevundimonas sp.]|uniref:endonuclease domain-containing protein n=1 Tax=Brevundimonas sp. TaxID=1871086 RepID=UPI003002F30D
MRPSVLTQKRARRLRRKMSLPEVLLWQRLRGRGFRRQHPVGPFILDFFCSSTRLAIEVDGLHHEARADQDARRDAHLLGLGIQTLRIPASEVLRDPDGAAERILGQLDED